MNTQATTHTTPLSLGEGTGVRLSELLESRDKRHALQLELLEQHPTKTLVCMTVIMPGAEKRNDTSLIIARAASIAARAVFGNEHMERDLPTGYEAYWLAPLPPAEAKRRACSIEETHPLGRLFDLDIILPDGTPMSRQSIGAKPRRCLLCNNEARFCMRNHSHTQEELLARIKELTDSYKSWKV